MCSLLAHRPRQVHQRQRSLRRIAQLLKERHTLVGQDRLTGVLPLLDGQNPGAVVRLRPHGRQHRIRAGSLPCPPAAVPPAPSA